MGWPPESGGLPGLCGEAAGGESRAPPQQTQGSKGTFLSQRGLPGKVGVSLRQVPAQPGELCAGVPSRSTAVSHTHP